MSRSPITRARPYTPASGVVEGQTFRSERQYRNALARAKGFRSWAAQQAAPARPVTSDRDLRRLRPSERVAYQKAGTVLTEMGNHPGLSLTAAARRAHTTPAAVKRHAGSALQRLLRGRFAVLPDDRHYRRLWFITADGLVILETRSRATASLIAQFDSAVARFLETGDPSRLARFRGRVVRAGGVTYPFVTDLDALEALGRQGEISFESIYASAR